MSYQLSRREDKSTCPFQQIMKKDSCYRESIFVVDADDKISQSINNNLLVE